MPNELDLSQIDGINDILEDFSDGAWFAAMQQEIGRQFNLDEDTAHDWLMAWIDSRGKDANT